MISLDRAAQAGLLAASKYAEATLKRRIFNKGEATSGRIGRYRSRSYRKKRRAAGRQTGYKDLEFYGDLRRSIQTGRTGSKVTVGFASSRQREIAGYQEEQTGKRIFKLNQNEIDGSREAFIAAFRNAARRTT